MLTLLSAPSGVSARAVYRDASPAADTQVVGTPRDVLVTFSEEVKTLTLVVRGPNGVSVNNGPPIINPTDRTNVSVPIHAAGDGRYQVDWDVVSGYDLDETSGSFGFWVGLATVPVVVAPTPTPAPPVAPAPAPVVVLSPPVAPTSPGVARDGRSLSGEPPSTQAQFRALWGDQADVEWATEHNAALTRTGQEP